MIARLSTLGAASPLWEAWTAFQLTGSLPSAIGPVLGYVVARARR